MPGQTEPSELERLEDQLFCYVSDVLRREFTDFLRVVTEAIAASDWAKIRSKIWDLWLRATESLVKYVEPLSNYGSAKKKAVEAALGYFYDHVIQPLDLPCVPAGAEYFVDAAAKKVLLSMADTAIDYLVDLFNRLDIFEHRGVHIHPAVEEF